MFDKTVLLVEDNYDYQVLVRHAFNRHGAKTVVAASGEAALNVFKRGQFNLVIIDFFLPGINGADVAKSIRQVDPEAEIVFITAAKRSYVVNYFDETPGDRIIEKPLSQQDYSALVGFLN